MAHNINRRNMMGGYPRLTIGAKEEGSRSAAELLEHQRCVEMFEKALREIFGQCGSVCRSMGRPLFDCKR